MKHGEVEGGLSPDGPFQVGDLVDVKEDVSKQPYRPAGVARVLKVHQDGTYDVIYILSSGRRRRVPPSELKRSNIMKNENLQCDGGAAGEGGSRPSRNKHQTERFVDMNPEPSTKRVSHCLGIA